VCICHLTFFLYSVFVQFDEVVDETYSIMLLANNYYRTVLLCRFLPSYATRFPLRLSLSQGYDMEAASTVYGLSIECGV